MALLEAMMMAILGSWSITSGSSLSPLLSRTSVLSSLKVESQGGRPDSLLLASLSCCRARAWIFISSGSCCSPQLVRSTLSAFALHKSMSAASPYTSATSLKGVRSGLPVTLSAVSPLIWPSSGGSSAILFLARLSAVRPDRRVSCLGEQGRPRPERSRLVREVLWICTSSSGFAAYSTSRGEGRAAPSICSPSRRRRLPTSGGTSLMSV
mmetsp:Transcript_3799/g.8142  ORF Transcript_3799/g.8142 Transcript_3799/m.8142 type:complete len:210 (+) Transcript_3799:2065-2694(+)